MGKLVLAALFLGAGIAGWRILRYVAAQVSADPRRERQSLRLQILSRLSLGIGSLIALLIVVFSIVVIIPSGHVGVVVLFGKVEPRQIPEGIAFVAPWKDVISMSIRIQKKLGKFDAASKDLQAVHVEMATNLRLIADSAPKIYQTVGQDYHSIIVQPAEQEVLKAHTALYVASDVLHQRPKLKAEVQQDLEAWLFKYGIQLTEVAISNIRFDPNYEKAIEAKQIEEQKAEQKRYELLQAQRQAEIVAAQAKGVADQVREAAKGEADALRFKGQAQAEYNKKVSDSLTAQLISQQWIDAWKAGAAVPTFVGGGTGQNFLLQVPLPQLKATEK